MNELSMESQTVDVEQAVAIIRQLYEKYENDQYMAMKTHNYICNQVPVNLQNILSTYQSRINRNEELTNEQNTFIQSFLSNNRYFYVNSSDKYFYYDGIHYKDFNEDDILHHILTSITRDRNLISWKYKTKTTIMKKIRDNFLLKSLPESDTIQNVILSLYPAFFKTKYEAKYFLTVIGDNILKKNNNLIHYLPQYTKQFIREFNIYCQTYIGVNLFQTFKYKYHEDHDYHNCRLIHFHETIKYENIWKPIIESNGIDILCVAVHYSIRYGSSDNYVNSTQDIHLRDYSFYLKDKSAEDLTNVFLNEYIKTGEKYSGVSISWKNLQYLWKHFLNSQKIPTVIYQTQLKNILIQRLNENYIAERETFQNIFSKYLPEIQKFVQFWDEIMVVDDSEYGLELEEIRHLFNKWAHMKRESVIGINEQQIIELIQHFYPEVEIENDKYIQHIRCSIWNKKLDIKIALEEFKNKIRSENNENDTGNISTYDAYIFYCKYYSYCNLESKDIVNKSYFDKYIVDNFTEFIVDGVFISRNWLGNLL